MQSLAQSTADSLTKSAVERASVAAIELAGRIHYLDNLRALAMLLGVFLHGALAYAKPAQSVWLATDTRSSVAIDVSIWFIHLFRMGLFFFLSGYFAKLVITRKGLRHFWWTRCLRIALPFVLFYPFLLACMTVVIVFALSYLDEPAGLMGVIAAARGDGGGRGQNQELPGTMHLWFLYYLMAFTALSALFSYLAPSDFKWPRWSERLRPQWVCLLPLLLVPGAVLGGTPLPAPESFWFQGWPFAFYGLFYVAGWWLFDRERRLVVWHPYVWHITLASCLLFVPYYWLMPKLDISLIVEGTIAPATYWQRGAAGCLTAYLSVSLTLVSLLLGQKYLAGESPWLRWMADASYWIYLVHLPVVAFLQTLLIPLAWPLVLKLMIVLVGTLVSSLATYVVFVRYTPIGAMLHGKRAFP